MTNNPFIYLLAVLKLTDGNKMSAISMDCGTELIQLK